MENKIFKLRSGVDVGITSEKLFIYRTSIQSRAKSLFKGRTSGGMIIRLSDISGILLDGDTLFVFGLGLPCPTKFGINDLDELKKFPNCIIGPPKDLAEIYNCLDSLL